MRDWVLFVIYESRIRPLNRLYSSTDDSVTRVGGGEENKFLHEEVVHEEEEEVLFLWVFCGYFISERSTPRVNL